MDGWNTDDMPRLSAANIFKRQNAVCYELLILTTVSFELTCIRDGCFCLEFENCVIQG